MKRWLNGLTAVSILLTLSGCIPKTNTIEEINPAVLLFIDRNEKGRLVQTTVIPPLRKESKQILTEEVTLIKEANNEFNKSYYREMKNGQLRLLMISRKLAEGGVWPILNTLILDPEISDRLFVSVIEGDYTRYLKNQLEKNEDNLVDVYLYKMFSHYEKQGELTITNLHNFLEAYFSPYTDPVVPIFKTEGEKLVYQGTAVFQDSKMVGRLQSVDDIMFQYLVKKKTVRKIIPLPEKQISLGVIHSSTDITIQPKETIKIRLDLRGRVEEYQGDKDLKRNEEADRLREELESYLEERTTSIVRRLQQWGVDPLRIGERTLTPFSRPYTERQWEKVWKRMAVEVDVNLRLESLGILKK